MPPVRVADLPWYDLPALAPATDALWSGIARHLRRLGVDRVPDRLRRDDDCRAVWADPDLLLSQACGYDVLYDSRQLLRPVVTPIYTLPGCRGPRYASEIVVRADSPFRDLASLRGTRIAVNEACSHSGCNAPRPLFAGLATDGRYFGSVRETGSHTKSVVELQRGRCDAACVDTVVLGLMRDLGQRRVQELRTLAVTGPALAPPYVTSRHTPRRLVTALREALFAAAADPALAACRQQLRIGGFRACTLADYGELRRFEAPALRSRWFELPAPVASPLTRAAARHAARRAAQTGAPGGDIG